MKKITFALAACVVFAFAACGNNATEETTGDTMSNADTMSNVDTTSSSADTTSNADTTATSTEAGK